MGCYGTLYPRENNDFCGALKGLVFDWDVPWLLIGDFNEVMDLSKKFGGNS